MVNLVRKLRKCNVKNVALILKSSYETGDKAKPLNETCSSNVGRNETHQKIREAKIRETHLRMEPVNCRTMQVTL